MATFTSHEDVIARCGTAALAGALSSRLGYPVSPKRVGAWRHRRSIPGSFFVAVAAAATDLGVADVTVEELARLAASSAPLLVGAAAAGSSPATVPHEEPAALAEGIA